MGLLLFSHTTFNLFGAETLALDTTVTSASEDVTTPQKTPYSATGFDAGPDEYTAPNFGSIADGDYTDGDSNSRTVTSCYWVGDTESMFLGLNTINVPDLDATFSKIVIDGVEFTRAAAEPAHNNNGGTIWGWVVATNPFAGTNPDDFEVWVI